MIKNLNKKKYHIKVKEKTVFEHLAFSCSYPRMKEYKKQKNMCNIETL